MGWRAAPARPDIQLISIFRQEGPHLKSVMHPVLSFTGSGDHLTSHTRAARAVSSPQQHIHICSGIKGWLAKAA